MRRWLISTAASLLVCGAALSTEPSLSLIEAMRQGDLATTEELLSRSADISEASPDGMTALHWAVHHDWLTIAEQLVESGANVKAANRYGVMPLSLACENGNRAIVELLLDAGADSNSALAGGESVLMTAARTGKLGPVQALLAAGADLDATEEHHQTALMWAAADGHADVVSALINAGADFRKPLDSGFTPLFFAVRAGHRDVVFRLLDAGIDVNDPMLPRRRSGKGPPKGISPLVLATENGHFELAVDLLDAGAEANSSGSGYTALHAITWVRKPIRGDGDPSPIGSGSLSSLSFVRELVSNGADINARHRKVSAGNGRLNRTDATPFLLACETGDVALMRLMVELGADYRLTNADDCTPLLAASGVGVLGDGDESAGTEEDAIDAIKMLLELGADINAADRAGNTAMHGAAYKSWTKLVQFLTDHGADQRIWDQKNGRGWTPLLIAQGNRPGNFRPSIETVEALQRVTKDAD